MNFSDFLKHLQGNIQLKTLLPQLVCWNINSCIQR